MSEHVHQRVVFLREGGQRLHEPGAQAVGVDGHAQGAAPAAGRFGRQAGQVAAQFAFQQGHGLCVAAQLRTRFGGSAGLAAHHQHRAHAFFSLADALRHGRRREVQRPRRAVKAAFAHHGGQGVQKRGVQHGQGH